MNEGNYINYVITQENNLKLFETQKDNLRNFFTDKEVKDINLLYN